MRKIPIVSAGILLLTAGLFSSQAGCNQAPQEKANTGPVAKELSQDELIARGNYLVTIASCNDCHSPKIFTPQGPVPDSTRLLSGHPAGAPLMPIDKKVLKPGNWELISPDRTAFTGPWGISYPANLTPDSVTGIGAWTEDVFIQTIRKGKHLGQEGGRSILPPMPWFYIARCTDEDLKAIFTYLKSLPPVINKVPPPTPPDEVAKMK
jgi:mono/diheme cytochrome c family protein